METLLKIAICDDNPILRIQLKKDITAYFQQLKIPVDIRLFASGEELTAVACSYYMAFLDVEMGKVNGITAGYWLKEQNPDICLFIITAYQQFLDDAFDLEAFRFLQKPIDKGRLYRGLRAAMARDRRLTCTLDGKLRVLFVKDIVCAYAEHGKTVLVTRQKTYRTTYPLSYWKQNLFDPFFAQPHSSYLINFSYVTQFEKESLVLEYGDNKRLRVYISQRKYTPFKHNFFRWMETSKP